MLVEVQWVNIEKVIIIVVFLDNLVWVCEFSQIVFWVYGIQGIYFYDVESYLDEVEVEICVYVGDDKIVVVGEIGLDYFYDNVDWDI